MPNNPASALRRLGKNCLLLAIAALITPMVGAAAPHNYQAQVQTLIDNSRYQEAAKVLGQASAGVDDEAARQEIFIQQGDIYYYYLEDYR